MNDQLVEQVRALLEQAPGPPGSALPPGATEQAIADLEESGILIPAEVKRWLRLCNAPCVGPGGLYGVAPAPTWLS
ncbi:MAG: hypothetical protein K0Q72_4538, partial [Armatimonadetes bacterium]|nr:hypothetical protein [Armatimonadota bacterium]